MFQSKDCIVAKLFAKHIKLKDAIDYVKKTRWVDQPEFWRIVKVVLFPNINDLHT